MYMISIVVHGTCTCTLVAFCVLTHMVGFPKPMLSSCVPKRRGQGGGGRGEEGAGGGGGGREGEGREGGGRGEGGNKNRGNCMYIPVQYT